MEPECPKCKKLMPLLWTKYYYSEEKVVEKGYMYCCKKHGWMYQTYKREGPGLWSSGAGVFTPKKIRRKKP